MIAFAVPSAIASLAESGGMLREMYGEAAFVVDDETEGSTPGEKLKVGADALGGP